MIGRKYQTKSSMQLVIVTGEYEGTDRNDDPSGIYYKFIDEKGHPGEATHFMSQSSVPHRLEGPICPRCEIVKVVPGAQYCASCEKTV